MLIFKSKYLCCSLQNKIITHPYSPPPPPTPPPPPLPSPHLQNFLWLKPKKTAEFAWTALWKIFFSSLIFLFFRPDSSTIGKIWVISKHFLQILFGNNIRYHALPSPFWGELKPFPNLRGLLHSVFRIF